MAEDALDSFVHHLSRFTSGDWQHAVDTLAAEMHPIDRNAARIWFAFFPLDLHLAIERADDPAKLARTLGLMGRWRLADQVDGSHRFLYAHRYWPQVKSAIASVAAGAGGRAAERAWRPGPGRRIQDSLAVLMTAIADAASRTARVDREMLLGISAVGLMTLRQVGPAAFSAAPGRIHLPDRARLLTPHQVRRRRARDDSQGLFGFLRGLRRRWTVTFDENDPEARFTLIAGQEIASAAQTDKRDYRSRDSRCIPGEGPIPVECRSASCGTCWVGVVGGAEKLSPVVERDEGRRMKVFGYVDTGESRPLIRLACQAKAFGAVSIVIPPWNGVFGRLKTDDGRRGDGSGG
jgi:ferredoxin